MDVQSSVCELRRDVVAVGMENQTRWPIHPVPATQPTAPPARSRRAYLSAADRTDCSPAGGPGSLCTCRRPLALAAIGQDKGRRIIVLARDRARDPATAPACVNLYGSTYCIRRKLTLFLSPPWRRCWPCSIRTHGLTGAFAIIPCMSHREKLAPK
jgi:hypothetical protein